MQHSPFSNLKNPLIILINLHAQTMTKLMTGVPLLPFYFSRFPYIFSSPSTASRPLLLFFHVFHYFFFPIHSTLLSNPTFTSSTHSSLSPCSFHRAVHHFEPFEFANRIYEVDRRFRIDRMASKAREIAFDHVNDAVLRCNVYSIHERLGSFV